MYTWSEPSLKIKTVTKPSTQKQSFELMRWRNLRKYIRGVTSRTYEKMRWESLPQETHTLATLEYKRTFESHAPQNLSYARSKKISPHPCYWEISTLPRSNLTNTSYVLNIMKNERHDYLFRWREDEEFPIHFTFGAPVSFRDKSNRD